MPHWFLGTGTNGLSFLQSAICFLDTCRQTHRDPLTAKKFVLEWLCIRPSHSLSPRIHHFLEASVGPEQTAELSRKNELKKLLNGPDQLRHDLAP